MTGPYDLTIEATPWEGESAALPDKAKIGLMRRVSLNGVVIYEEGVRFTDQDPMEPDFTLDFGDLLTATFRGLSPDWHERLREDPNWWLQGTNDSQVILPIRSVTFKSVYVEYQVGEVKDGGMHVGPYYDRQYVPAA